MIREGHEFYLTAPSIDNPSVGVAYYDAADRLLDTLVGLARVNNPNVQPVSASGRCTEGDLQSYVVRPKPAEIRVGGGTPTVTVTNPEGNVVNVPEVRSPWPGWLATAQSQPEIVEALTIMARPALEWPDLYNVFEIIRASVVDVRILGTATKPQVSRFTGSAQPHRHAGRRTDVLANPMCLAEGREFVSNLMAAWLASRTDRTDS
ncbi:hypothetical protein BKG79_22205 [Mycobacteroides chelonae]|nr:hypothetical protein BKG79_22205 [Mycobacteroides chelonae]